MRCKKCGKRLREKENFCTICGYYNGEVTNLDLDDDDEEMNLLDDDIDDFHEEEDEMEEESLNSFSFEKYSKKEQDKEFEKSYIGEDYNLIKNGIFNIYAALLNWMYCLYRKMYITGIIGLIITGIVIVLFPKIFIFYAIITIIILGFVFNKIYLLSANWKIKRILEKYKGSDNYTLQSIVEEKGGVNFIPAILIYFIFLVVVIINLFHFQYNTTHNTKFWKENSENQANCISFTHKAYDEIKNRIPTTYITEAGCKISKSTVADYEIYLKDISNNMNIYHYYRVNNGYITYQKNTEKVLQLQQKKNLGTITQEEEKELLEEKNIVDSYSLIYKNAKEEDQLIKERKNTNEKKYYIFSEEEVTR